MAIHWREASDGQEHWLKHWGWLKWDQTCTQTNMLALFPLTTARDRRRWSHCPCSLPTQDSTVINHSLIFTSISRKRMTTTSPRFIPKNAIAQKIPRFLNSQNFSQKMHVEIPNLWKREGWISSKKTSEFATLITSDIVTHQ